MRVLGNDLRRNGTKRGVTQEKHCQSTGSMTR
jgi:hypothetical protein